MSLSSNQQPEPEPAVIELSSDDEEEKPQPIINKDAEEPKPGPSRRSRPVAQSSSSKPEASINGSNGTQPELTERRKQQFERVLIKYMEKIEEIDSKVVDWEDEDNSAYIMKDRMTNKLMKMYGLLCKRSGNDVNLTGRPMQKKFSFDKVTRFPEIDKAVEKFLNKFCKAKAVTKQEVSLSAPEYHDILDVVNAEIEQSNLVVVPTEVSRMAEDLFKHTIQMYRKRRGCELKMALALPAASADPAETDAELRRKLAENVKKRRREEDVVREFALKQQQLADEKDLVATDDEEEESSTEQSDDEPGNDADFLRELSDLEAEPSKKKRRERHGSDSD